RVTGVVGIVVRRIVDDVEIFPVAHCDPGFAVAMDDIIDCPDMVAANCILTPGLIIPGVNADPIGYFATRRELKSVDDNIVRPGPPGPLRSRRNNLKTVIAVRDLARIEFRTTVHHIARGGRGSPALGGDTCTSSVRAWFYIYT